jgi:predicted phosphohydrolase
MALYVIGDTHLSLSVDKPMEVFSGWDRYEQRLQEQWCSLVTEQDTVVIPGDVSWAMSLEQAKEDFAFLNALPGRKLLLKGNHDYWWTTRRKMDAFLAENGFDTIRFVHNDAVAVDNCVAVCGTRGWFYDAEEDADQKILLREVGRLRTSVKAAVDTGLTPIVFLHYPPVWGGQVCEPFLQVLREFGVTRCYYGHVHGPGIRQAFNGVYDGISLQLASADALKFVPLHVPCIK